MRDTVILDTATLIYTIIMQVHRMQHTRHHNTPQQIQIVVHRMQILRQLVAVAAAAEAAAVVVQTVAVVAMVDRPIVPAATNRHHTDSVIMCSVNQESTMVAVVIR